MAVGLTIYEKIRAITVACAAVLCFLCFATIASAQNTMTLTSAGTDFGTPPLPLVGPYYATITINGVTAVGVAVICDDFGDDTGLNEMWDVNVTQLSTLQGESTPSTSLMWDNYLLTQQPPLDPPPTAQQIAQQAADQQTDYAEAAYLAEQLVNPNVTCPEVANCLADIQFAIWNVFTPSDPSNKNTPFANLTGNDLDNANYWYNLAVANAGSISNYTNVTAYTPTNVTGPPQEFLVVTPEASTPLILAADVLGFLGVFVFLRRRALRNA